MLFARATGQSVAQSSRSSLPRAAIVAPAILAALKRAAQIRQQEDALATTETNPSSNENDTTQIPQDQARNKALLAKLQSQSGYDDVDVNMGFGGDSRYDDEDEDDLDYIPPASHTEDSEEEEGDDDEPEDMSGIVMARRPGMCYSILTTKSNGKNSCRLFSRCCQSFYAT